MILNDDETYDSMSEEEMEALEQVAMHRQVNEDEDQVFCDEDSSPALVVSKVLTLQHQHEENPSCENTYNAVMPLSRASTRGRYSRIVGVTKWMPLGKWPCTDK